MPDVTSAEKETFDLSTRHGRDAICQRIEADVDLFCKQYFADDRRGYMGASTVGNGCNRYLWQTFRWIKQENFDGRMMRLFNTGHREEAMFILYLRAIGFTVEEIDPNTEKQYRIYGAEGHYGGSCDGLGLFPNRYGLGDTIKLLFEFKTSAEKAFKEVENTGFRDAKPVHWSQVCQYGYGFGADYVVYGMKNKNTDKIEWNIEEIDKDFGKQEIEKASALVQLQTAPPRIADNSMIPPCKFCLFRGNCFNNEKAERNCRSCLKAATVANGEWHCAHYGMIIPKEFIPQGCGDWISII